MEKAKVSKLIRHKKSSLAEKINVLRASVMGANDGILSIAGIVIGVAGATSNSYAIFLAGIAGMLAGTVSMAMGEYVSVNSQRDMERRAVQEEIELLDDHYDDEVDFVTQKYLKTGLKPELAKKAVEEMMAKDALETTVRERFGFDPKEHTSAVAAAIASMISFPTGSILPLVAITLMPRDIRVIATVIAVIIALSLTGYAAAALGNANRAKAVIRNVISGSLTMLITYGIGSLFAR
ncbi:MAG: VIT family protein [Lactobacillus sp.]|jgi:VIT1/CCC1 family predicted Fe2+/Mn2+ transporter|nr:VIT family protein [Lactobacillus sp.]